MFCSRIHLDLRRLGTAEALLHLDLEVASQCGGAVQRGHPRVGLHDAVLLAAHVHGRVTHDVLLEGGGRGKHLVQVCRTWWSEGNKKVSARVAVACLKETL